MHVKQSCGAPNRNDINTMHCSNNKKPIKFILKFLHFRLMLCDFNYHVQSLSSKMFVCIAVFVVLIKPQTSAIGTFCQLEDCALTNLSNCSWFDLPEEEFYVPLEPPNPAAADPDHLFNLIYDPTEKSCIFLKVGRIILDNGRFALYLKVQCAFQLNGKLIIFFDVNFQQPDSSALISCIKRDAVGMNQAKKCGFIAREQLRLTFSGNGDKLLVEDLSGEGQNRTSLLLKKTKYYRNMVCNCNDLEAYHLEKIPCIIDAEIEILNRNLVPNNNRSLSANKG